MYSRLDFALKFYYTSEGGSPLTEILAPTTISMSLCSFFLRLIVMLNWLEIPSLEEEADEVSRLPRNLLEQNICR